MGWSRPSQVSFPPTILYIYDNEFLKLSLKVYVNGQTQYTVFRKSRCESTKYER